MKLTSTFLLASLAFSFYAKGQNSSSATFQIESQDLFGIEEEMNYTFGYLVVPENRTDSNSRDIKLPVYIFKSRSQNPKPDPIIYTVGGPGSSTMPSAQYMKYYEYLDDRDFILIEQRGTAYAEPALNCPEWSEAQYLANLPDCDKACSDSLLQKAAFACRTRLQSEEGVDLLGYTTTEIAADVHDLVDVLEIEEYNLLTISYSTKIAQVLMRDYPQGIRSVVMDSPLPLEANYDEESVDNLLEVMDRMLQVCELDSACNSEFPDLKLPFMDLLLELSQNPLELDVVNPTDDSVVAFRVVGEDIVSLLSFSLGSTASIPSIPKEIDKLLKKDYSTLRFLLGQSLVEPDSFEGIGVGMRLCVWCREERAFANDEVIEEKTFSHPEVEGMTPELYSKSVCSTWGVVKADDRENLPVVSDIPVLLISGEFDPVTPVRWAESMTYNLTNSYHMVFKGWSHTPTTYWSNTCGMKAANAFFNDPHRMPAIECVEEVNNSFNFEMTD